MVFAPQSVYIIAEAGVNHDGSEARAHQLVDIAIESGADAVKFQMFAPEALTTDSAPTATYQATNLGDKRISQRDMLKKLTLPDDAYPQLAEYCASKKIDFLCTPFDHGSLAYLTTHTHLRHIKLPSGEITNGPLLLAVARTGLPVILSTGMSNLQEIGEALSILHFGYTHKTGYPKPGQPDEKPLKELQDKVTLLHCVSQYPAPAETTNLSAMDSMKEAFGLKTGLSDHSEGIAVALLACARGATMIEKHFTYDKNAAGPDHKASLMPDELSAMVRGIRSGSTLSLPNEKTVLGDGRKQCQPVEENTRAVARKSLVAARSIGKGALFGEGNLTCKRPAGGELPPNALWQLLGKKAKRDYAADDFIDAGELTA